MPSPEGTPRNGEAFRAFLASQLSPAAMARLQQVSEHSGLSYREILAQAIDFAWHVQMSGELDRRPEGAPAADVPASSEGQLAVPIPDSLRRVPQIEHTIERIRTETSLTHDQLQDVLSRLHAEALLRPDQSYHGWTNYETWCARHAEHPLVLSDFRLLLEVPQPSPATADTFFQYLSSVAGTPPNPFPS